MTPRGREEGQAAVELALLLPLVVALALTLVQVALVVRDQVLVVHAAREAARAAAVEGEAGARRAATRASPLKWGSLVVDTLGGGHGRVSVRIEYRSPTDVPLVGPLVPDVPLVATATMWDERGEGG